MVYVFGDFELDVRGRELRRGGRVSKILPELLFKVLLYLLEHHDRLVPNDELLETFWADKEGHIVVEEGALTKCIERIRGYLGDNGEQACFIRNIRKGGYRFVAQVMTQPMESGYCDRGMAPPLTGQRYMFDHLIETHTHLFAGRSDALQAILNFINTESCGYIFVEALSGYGKTSLLAKLVQDNPWFAYHFISQAYKAYGADFDPTEMESLLLNLCEQVEGDNASLVERRSPRARFHAFLRSSPAKGPRVVVIDAVDEVNRHPNYLRGLLPASLPPGIFVIFSARILGDRNYIYEVGLEEHQIGKTISLPGLDEKAIVELLSMVGGPARSLARLPDFVAQVYHVSEGDPFYLRFLIEDVARGKITPQNITDTPSGVYAYLDMQLTQLDRSAHTEQQRTVIGIILAAHAPLSRGDLINMVDGLDGLNFDNIIRDIHRFLLTYNDNYTFCHSRFKEYFESKI